MSRNVRQKYPRTPAKATKRRGSNSSSSLNLSDDDNGYSGVEDVSESDDDDDEHVFAAEEKHIITNASRKRVQATTRPLDSEDDDADADEEAEDEEDGEEEEEDAAEDVAVDDTASWNGILSDHNSPTTEHDPNYIFNQEITTVERHVRFTGVPDSDSDSTTSETSEDIEGFFPDIFVDQNALDPAFRREIEHDDDSSNSGSFWDFNTSSQDMLVRGAEDEAAAGPGSDDITPVATPAASRVPTEVSTPIATGEVQELDGYESEFNLWVVALQVVLMLPRQPMATRQKRTCRSRLYAASSCGVFHLSNYRLIRTPRNLHPVVAATPVLAASTWTIRKKSPLPC